MHLFDADGRRYLDGVSSLWVTVHGHRVPEIDAAVREQLDKLAHSHVPRPHPRAGYRARRGTCWRRRPRRPAGAGAPLRRVFYAGDGSSAVEAALKMAYQRPRSAGSTGRSSSPSPRATTATRSARSASAASTRSTPPTGRSCCAPGRSRRPTGSAPRTRWRGSREPARAEGEQVCAVIIEPMVQAAGGHAHP